MKWKNLVMVSPIYLGTIKRLWVKKGDKMVERKQEIFNLNERMQSIINRKSPTTSQKKRKKRIEDRLKKVKEKSKEV